MQVKTIRIKNLFIFSCLVLRIFFTCLFVCLFVFFFHFSNFMITLIWSCIQLPQWATGVSFYTNPLKFPETGSKHLWLFYHFLFYSRFCISAPTPVTLAAIYFPKRGLGLLFPFPLFYFIIILFFFFSFLKRGLGLLFSFTLFYFIIIIHFNFYTFKTSKKINILQKLFNQWRLNWI